MILEPTILPAPALLPPPPGDGPMMAWREPDGRIYALRYDNFRLAVFLLIDWDQWERLAVN